MPTAPDRLDRDAAMARAAEIAARGPEANANPRVGCVLTAADGAVVGEGWHRGSGTPHAEVAALEDARARGLDPAGCAVSVTLEPCRHTGRTGPCVEALAAAGVARVDYAVPDPGAESGGGAEALRRLGIPAELRPLPAATALTERFVHAVRHGRPFVVLKAAVTVDGRVAAADGSSFWITGQAAREHAHGQRARAGAIVVGTETVLRDDPWLSARPGGVEEGPQPLRAVVGMRPTPGARVWRDGNAVHLPTRDPAEALEALAGRGVRTVILEGGPTLHSAFMRAGLVDELQVYTAPVLLGEGPSLVSGLGIGTMERALRLVDVSWTPLGDDVLMTARPTREDG